jgi:hypothetical protein
MSLDLTRPSQRYGAAVLSRARSQLGNVAVDLERRSRPVVEFRSTVAAETTDSRLPELDDLIQRLEPLHERLASRVMKGESLNNDEHRILTVMNALLSSRMPRPVSNSPQVEQALLRADQILKKHQRG